MPTDQSSKVSGKKYTKCDGCGNMEYCDPFWKRVFGIPFLKWYCWVCYPSSRK